MNAMVIVSALIGFSAIAGEIKVGDLNCAGYDKGEQNLADTEIYVTLDDLVFYTNKDNKVDGGSARSFKASIIVKDTEWNIVPTPRVGSWEGKNLENTDYNGRKYEGYLEFDLTENIKARGFPETAKLIVSPEYEVVKRIPQTNVFDPSWNWEIEIRKHDARLDTHFDDHHGDYVKMECYSVKRVNDSKGRH